MNTISIKKLTILGIFALVLFDLNSKSIIGQTVKDPLSSEIVVNKIHEGGLSKIRSRTMYVFLPESLFSSQYLSDEIQRIAGESCDPYELSIFLYSDKESLKKRINFDKREFYVDFPDNEQGRRDSEEYHRKNLPDPKQYLSAEYTRYGDYEYLYLRLSKHSIEENQYIIRSPSIKNLSPNVCKSASDRIRGEERHDLDHQ